MKAIIQNPYFRLMRFHRPIGIFLLLWPTLIALWIAGEGRPDLFILTIFVSGAIVMRSAGCIINDIIDQNFDGKVERTKDRPLVVGTLIKAEAYLLFFVLLMLAFLLVLELNFLTIQLSLAALILAVMYPFMKRITYLPQLVLGAAFAMAVPMAFSALVETIPPVAYLLYLITFIWTVIYDTEYSMVDRNEDLRIGIKSTAILFGSNDRIIIGGLQLVLLLLLIGMGLWLQFGFFYFSGVLFAAAFGIYQQYLIRDRDPTLCFKAFMNNNLVGACLFLGVMVDFWFKNQSF